MTDTHFATPPSALQKKAVGRAAAAFKAKQTGPDPIDVEVGARVRTRRRMAGLSQTDLASACGQGITFQQVQKYERGANRISASRLVQIAAALDCRAADLLPDTTREVSSDPLLAIVSRLATIPGALAVVTSFATATPEVRRIVADLMAALDVKPA